MPKQKTWKSNWTWWGRTEFICRIKNGPRFKNMRLFYRRLRPVSIRSLPSTCLNWINATQPLEASVIFFPRRVRLVNDLFHGVLWQGGLLLFFAGFAFFGFQPASESVSGNPYALIFLYSFMCLMLGGFVWVVLRFLETWSAWRQQQRGMLRLGVFVGEQFLLFRLRRQRCYLIARSDYIKSWAWQDGASGSLSSDEEAVVEYFIITSKRGEITVYSSQLEVTASDLHQHVLKLWPEKRHVEG